MQSPGRENNSNEQRDSKNKPKVLIVGLNNCEKPNFNYDNADFVSVKRPTEIKEKTEGFDLLVFIDESYEFSSEDSLSELVEDFSGEDLNIVGAAYTDIQGIIEGYSFPIKINPSFNERLYKEKFIINSPFIMRSNLNIEFHEGIEFVSLWDGLLSLMKKTIVFHLPKQYFRITNLLSPNPQISEEIKLIHEIYK